MSSAMSEARRSSLTIALLIALFVVIAWPRARAAARSQQLLAEVDLAKVISAPRPEYPYEARRANITGTGIVVIEVEPTTGRVKNAYMDPSTGSVVLDNAALWAFRRWRFKPGTVDRARTPITFTMGGPPVYEYRVKQKPMDDVLAHFLGKGVVIKGPIPAYPRFPPWTEKHGVGVYELHVQKDGTVPVVKVLKPSGDPTFDRITVETLRKWRLRRGPVILELPLSFKLTSTSYSVDIPQKH